MWHWSIIQGSIFYNVVDCVSVAAEVYRIIQKFFLVFKYSEDALVRNRSLVVIFIQFYDSILSFNLDDFGDVIRIILHLLWQNLELGTVTESFPLFSRTISGLNIYCSYSNQITFLNLLKVGLIFQFDSQVKTLRIAGSEFLIFICVKIW